MRNKLKYDINEEKRTITCVAFDCENDLILDLIKRCAGESIHIKALVSSLLQQPELYDKLMLANKYVGKAICYPDDTWDVEKGKRIARRKMRVKYNDAKLSKLNDCMKIIEQFHDVCLDMAQFSVNKVVETEAYYIKDITE